jgi:hypothetical protein
MSNAKTYPSDSKTQFFLCDDVREEKGGKLSLIGFMPEPRLIVQGYDPKVNEDGQVPGLTILMIFHDGVGKFATSLSLVSPSGKEIASPEMIAQTEKHEDGPMNIIINFRPFPIDIGIHKFTVTFDDKYRYERTFEMNAIKAEN